MRITKISFVFLFLSLGLLVVLSRLAAVKGENHGYLRARQTFDDVELADFKPANLAFSSALNLFFVLEEPSGSMPVRITTLTPTGKVVNTLELNGLAVHPANITFYDETDELFLISADEQEFIKIKGGAITADVVPTLATIALHSLNLDQPQGMAVDAGGKQLYVLDSGRQELVSVAIEELAHNDSEKGSQQGNITRVSLAHLGVADMQSLSFNSYNDHLYIFSPSQQRAFEITLAGQLITTYDLADFGLTMPLSMAVAPTADATDDPSIMSLYIIDNRPNLGTNQIIELSTSRPIEPNALVPTDLAILIRTTATSLYSPPSPDPAGIAYLPSPNSLMISDSEVNEMPIYDGANVFQTDLTGTLQITFTTLSFSNEPTGVAFNPANQHLFFSDDTGTRGVYEVDAGPDGMYGTADDIVTFSATEDFGSDDPEGVAYDTTQGHLFVVDGVNEEVYEINPGPDGIFNGIPPAGDDIVTNFDTNGLGILDPEGIEYDASNAHLYILSSKDPLIAETTTSGSLIRYVDISAANPDKPAGITYAPASDMTPVNHLYIVDRGVDNNSDPNENDGLLYEMGFAGPTAVTVQLQNVSVYTNLGWLEFVMLLLLCGTVSFMILHRQSVRRRRSS